MNYKPKIINSNKVLAVWQINKSFEWNILGLRKKSWAKHYSESLIFKSCVKTLSRSKGF